MKTNIEEIIANNISILRKSLNIKQSELGKLLGYSDKTVSKWETGLSAPDITALVELAKLFGVTVDDLTKENALEKSTKYNSLEKKRNIRNTIFALSFAVSIIWIASTIFFCYFCFYKNINYWQSFIWAVPLSSAYVFLFNAKQSKNWIIYLVTSSVFVWSIITGLYCHFITENIWLVFLLGAPTQVSITFYSLVFRSKNNRKFAINNDKDNKKDENKKQENK